MQKTDDLTASAAAPRPRKATGLPAFAMRKLSDLLERAVADSNVSCAVRFANGELRRFGAGEPQFTVTFNSDKPLLRPFNEYTLGKAYVEGEIDLEGDMFAMQEARKLLARRTQLGITLKFLADLLLKPATWVNKKAITQHYTLGDDFYLTFIDTAYRFYSQCVFHNDDETLEAAATHKLETMYEALQLKPGMRLLDIGAGWGGVHEYCGPRGIHVTSLTLTEDSYNYTRALDQRMGLENCKVIVEDFLDHEPAEPYDAVVIYGVIEHIPYYRKFCARLAGCLKPGGSFYLDASAVIRKFDVSDFTRRYIWPGSHSFLCLQDMIQELLYHGLDIVETKNETRDYGLTMKHWAERFEANKDKIVERWGQEIYRVFRMFMWTGCYGFFEDTMQAYHIVARRRADQGPRPGIRGRAGDFISSLR